MLPKYIDFLLGMLEEIENLIGFEPNLTGEDNEKAAKLLDKLREVLNDA